MSRISDFYKSEKNYEDFFSCKRDDDNTASIRREISSYINRTNRKREELNRAYAEMYGEGFVPCKTPLYLEYGGRNNSAIFEVYSCDLVDSETMKKNPGNKIHVYCKSGEIAYPVGYCYNLGAVVTRRANYSIVGSKCDNIKFTPTCDFFIPLIESTKEVIRYRYETGEKDKISCITDSSGSKGLENMNCTEFINNMYEIDRDDLGEINLQYVAEHMSHCCAEIIFKTCPASLIKWAFKKKATSAVPVHKLFEIEPDILEKAKEYEKTNPDFVARYFLVRNTLKDKGDDYCNRYNILRTDKQLLDLAVKAASLEKDMKFYNIDCGYYGFFRMCVDAYMGESYSYGRGNFYKYYPFGKFMNYVGSETVNQGFNGVNNFLTALADYISMVEQNHGTPTLYSSYLKVTHDIAKRNFNIHVTPEEEKIFKSRYEKIKNHSLDDYCFITPSCSEDIKKEGNDLNHCVASYIKRVIDGTCLIMFMRLNNAMDESLVTLEIEGNRIIQARGISNRNINDIERKTLVKFCEKYCYDLDA